MKKLIVNLILCFLFSGIHIAQASIAELQSIRISIEAKNEQLRDVFTQIEKKSGYAIVYEKGAVDPSKKVSINVQNESVDQILDKVLAQTGNDYTFVNSQIIITKTNKKTSTEQQQTPKKVTGSVIDETGESVIGASVTIPGTKTGTVTDIDGRFEINVPAEHFTIQVSYLGYQHQTVSITNKTDVHVKLNPENQGLDEIVVVGYGTVKKRDLTGAVQSIKSEDIVLSPTGNVMEALQGKVAGLDITRSSGKSGSEVNMVLRGNRSINGENTPLFIIDGVAGNYDDINPNDIASVEVLKDASSTAIYGSAGSNGVVIITTKNAKANSKLTVNFDAYYGVNGFLKFPAVRTGDDYIALRREAERTSGAWQTGDPDSKLFSNSEWDAIQSNQWVDWFDEGTRDGSLQNYSVSLSGGNERTTGYFSANYYKEEGILKNDDNTKYSFKATIDHKIRPWLNGGINVIGSFTDRNERRGQYFTRVLCLLPLGTPYNEDGSINPFPLAGDSQLSPIADMATDQYVNNYHITGLNPTVYLDIKPLKGLSFRTVASAYLNSSRQGVYRGVYSSEGYSQGKSSAQILHKDTYNYKWENILNYNMTLNEIHDLAFTGVTSWTKDQKEESSMLGYNVDYSKYIFHNMGVSDPASRQTTSSYVGSQLMSYVVRLNYSYQGRYLASISNRWDGSSILAKGNNWDYFPAGALAWRISDEAFMAGLDKIDNLKLRVGYGVTGNAGAKPYATLPFGTAGTNLAFQDTPAPYYMFSTTIANQQLAWEKSYNANIGIDLNMFNSRLNVNLDAYHTKTEDILFNRTLPASTGGSKTSNFTIWENICSTENRGVELVINSINIQKKDLFWSTTLTFASNHEEITSFTQDVPVANGDTWLIKGHPIKSHYNYKYSGIWQMDEAEEAAKFGRKPGDVKIEEVKADNNYTTDDRQVIGSPVPKWTAGLSNTITYKGIDLSVFFDARWGQTLNYAILGWYNPNGKGNGPAIIDYWTPENPDGRFPRPNASYTNFASMPIGTTSLTYVDGSYIKLRNITLGYTIPEKVLKKIDISKVRFYATVTNPWIYTKSEYMKDYDPERGGADEFPLSKQMVFGVNVTF